MLYFGLWLTLDSNVHFSSENFILTPACRAGREWRKGFNFLANKIYQAGPNVTKEKFF